MTVKDFIGYVIAQYLGGIAGAAILLGICGQKGIEQGLGTNSYSGSALGISMWGAIAAEIVLTCVFVYVILGVTSKKEFGSAAGLVIGLTLTLIHIFGIPLTGTSVNPARSFIGAALAAAIFILVNKEKE